MSLLRQLPRLRCTVRQLHAVLATPPSASLAHEGTRAVLQLQGRETAKLLQGLTTNDTLLLEMPQLPQLQYTMFLNAKVRI